MRNGTRGGIAAILAFVVALDMVDRYRLAPAGFAESAFGIVIVAMILAAATRAPLWHRVELLTLWVVIVLGLIYNALNLCNVINLLVFQAVQASKLFFTALAIWINNVLTFTLVYWLVDGGDTRVHDRIGGFPDFDFPAANESGKVKAGWCPGLVDYFFLGFTTATAFSPTEAQPLSARAKLLMVAESTMSLTTIAIVAARAINIIR